MDIWHQSRTRIKRLQAGSTVSCCAVSPLFSLSARPRGAMLFVTGPQAASPALAAELSSSRWLTPASAAPRAITQGIVASLLAATNLLRQHPLCADVPAADVVNLAHMSFSSVFSTSKETVFRMGDVVTDVMFVRAGSCSDGASHAVARGDIVALAHVASSSPLPWNCVCERAPLIGVSVPLDAIELDQVWSNRWRRWLRERSSRAGSNINSANNGDASSTSSPSHSAQAPNAAAAKEWREIQAKAAQEIMARLA